MKERLINTRFWSDGFIREKLNPLDRYLYLYFLTNEKTNISGIYELPKSIMSWETGIEEKTLQDMLERLKGKVEYVDGWVILVNFLKYQRTASESVMTGVKKCLIEAPKQVLDYAFSIGYGDGLDIIPPSSHISNLNLIQSEPEENALTYEEPIKETYQDKAKTYKKLGILYTPKKKSPAQDLAWQTEMLARYIKDKAMELLRIDVYINKKESGKGWQNLKRAVKEFGIEKCKAHCDKYLVSEKCEKFGADVSVMFSEHSMNMPTKKTQQGVWNNK